MQLSQAFYGRAACFSFTDMPCFFFLLIRKLNKVINKYTDCYQKADDTLLKITIQGLLIESFKVLSVLRVG